MKKVKMFTAFGIFIIGALLVVNMYSAMSYPGVAGGNMNCFGCHNGPVLATTAVLDNGTAFAPDLGVWPSDYSNTDLQWGNFSMYNTQYIFVMSVADAHGEPIRYIQTQFLNNGSHLLVKARMYTYDLGHKFGNDTHADAMAIIWNKNATDFTNQVFSKKGMATNNGTLDMWYLSTAEASANTSTMARDMFINEDGKGNDTTQNVYGAIHHGQVRTNVYGYWFMFARELTSADTNDTTFVADTLQQFSIAVWWENGSYNHFSSYDQYMIVGDSYDVNVVTEGTVDAYYVEDVYHVVEETVYDEVTQTKYVVPGEAETVATTITKTAANGFTLLLVLAGIFVAIPVFRKWRS